MLIRSVRPRGRGATGDTVNAECLGGLQVDDEFDFGCLLHRQVARLLAFENRGRYIGLIPARPVRKFAP